MKIDKINLISSELNNGMFISSSERLIAFLFLIEIVFILILASVQYIKKEKLNTQIIQFKTELSSLEMNFKNITQKQIIHETEVIKSNIIHEVLANKNRWSLYFKELSLLLPKKIWLTFLKIEKKDDTLNIDIKGEANSPTEISEFYLRLSRSVYFENIVIKQSELFENYTPLLYKFFFTTNPDTQDDLKETKDDDENITKSKTDKIISDQIKNIPLENKDLLKNTLLKTGTE
ncbi:MAG: PilN domain-containing protein [Oligoflexia bacterium]|nr:PilN domain-containing protein [Oligoflexia bacterium]